MKVSDGGVKESEGEEGSEEGEKDVEGGGEQKTHVKASLTCCRSARLQSQSLAPFSVGAV